MTAVVIKGESVYQCDVCNRRMRTPTNKFGLEVIQKCTITHNCKGKLHRVTQTSVINETPTFSPEVVGLTDWFQRRCLYVHTQHMRSNVWTIGHNLGGSPVIHAYVSQLVDGEYQLVAHTPHSVTLLDSNTTQLTFSDAFSGIAQCVNVASQNTTNPQVSADSAEESSYFQLTSSTGVLVLATIDDSPIVSVGMSFSTSGAQQGVNLTYAGIPISVNGQSPWVGAGSAIINGKKYVLRSINITETSPAPVYFAQGAIPNGTSCYINNIDGRPIAPGEVLVLLGKAPYASVDKVTNQYVDASSLGSVITEMYYTDRVLYANVQLQRPVYPPVLVV